MTSPTLHTWFISLIPRSRVRYYVVLGNAPKRTLAVLLYYDYIVCSWGECRAVFPNFYVHQIQGWIPFSFARWQLAFLCGGVSPESFASGVWVVLSKAGRKSAGWGKGILLPLYNLIVYDLSSPLKGNTITALRSTSTDARRTSVDLCRSIYYDIFKSRMLLKVIEVLKIHMFLKPLRALRPCLIALPLYTNTHSITGYWGIIVSVCTYPPLRRLSVGKRRWRPKLSAKRLSWRIGKLGHIKNRENIVHDVGKLRSLYLKKWRRK